MMNYAVEHFDSKDFGYLIFSTGYWRLDESITELESIILGKRYKGKVLFDLLLANGTEDRYYEGVFNGKRFDYKSIKYLHNVSRDIQAATSCFYLKHLDFLDNSVLPKAKKVVLKKKLLAEADCAAL